MSERLRDALEQLADRGRPSDPDEFAARVLRQSRRGSGRGPWLLAAAAAVLVVVVAVAVVPDDDDRQAQTGVVTEPTRVPITLAPAPPTWYRAALPADATGSLQSTAADGTTVVAVGSGRPPGWGGLGFYSDDAGVTWHRADFPKVASATVLDVAAIDGSFVAVGEIGGTAVAWRSADGRAWSPVEMGQGSAQAVTAARGRLVAVGSTPRGSEPSPAAWHSDDGGRTWRRATVDGPAGTRTYATTVTATADGWVMAGAEDGHAAVWTSTDGARWARVPHDSRAFPPEVPMLDLGFGDDGIVAVGSPSGVWTSADGRAWAKHPGPPGNFRSLAKLRDETWVASGVNVGGNSPGAWASADGRTWQPIEHAAFGLARGEALGATEAGTNVVVVGSVGPRGDELSPVIWVRR